MKKRSRIILAIGLSIVAAGALGMGWWYNRTIGAGTVSYRQATPEDWAQIETILRADPNVAITELRIPEYRRRLLEDASTRFYVFIDQRAIVGVTSMTIGETEITFEPFYVIKKNAVRAQSIFSLVLETMRAERKDGRTVVNKTYADLIKTFGTLYHYQLSIRQLVDPEKEGRELYEIKIRHADIAKTD